MPRHIISGVTLSGWLGFRLQHFEIGHWMTQMLGSNGSGKTTAMTAFVMPFVPLPKRLNDVIRKVRSPEGVEHTGGLSGYMSPGDPVNVAVTLSIGSRCVHVCASMRRSSNAMGVEVRPYLVEGLPQGVLPARWLSAVRAGTTVLLDDRGISTAVAQLGGTVWRPQGNSIKDWYACLYERRILPRNFQDASEQALLANLLLTSFGQKPEDALSNLGAFLLAERDGSASLLDEVRQSHENFRQVALALEQARGRHTAVDTLWTAARGLYWAGIEHCGRALLLATEARDEADGVHVRASTAERESEQALSTARMAMEQALATAAAARASQEATSSGVMQAFKACESMPVPSPEVVLASNAREDIRGEGEVSLPRTVDLEFLLERLSRAAEEERALLRAAEHERDALAAELEQAKPRSREHSDKVARTLGASPRWDGLTEAEAFLADAALGPRRLGAEVVADAHAAALDALVTHPREAVYHSGGIVLPKVIGRNGHHVAFDDGDGFVRIALVPDATMLGAVNRERSIAAKRVRDAALKGEVSALMNRLSALDKEVARCKAALSVSDEVLNRVPGRQARKMRQQRLGALRLLGSINVKSARSGLSHDERTALEPDEAILADKHLAAVVALAVAESALAVVGSEVSLALSRHGQAMAMMQAASADLDVKVSVLDKSSTAHEEWDTAYDERADVLGGGMVRKVDEVRTPGAAAMQMRNLLIGPGAEQVVVALEYVGIPNQAILKILDGLTSQLEPHDPRTVIGLLVAARAACAYLASGEAGDTADPMDMLMRLHAHVDNLLPMMVLARDSKAGSIRQMHARMVGDVRDAGARIERLNDDEDIHFGKMTGVRLVLVERKGLLDGLRALLDEVSSRMDARESDIETLMVEANRKNLLALPRNRPLMDEAMDYRSYCGVQVEVRRGDGPFEPLYKTGGSTGETIGVAFTCLLRVLQYWERQDIRRLPDAPLRLLFIDEVGRMDRDAVATVCDLADRNETCVVVAAPADSVLDGACTTFHLLRKRDADGVERVRTVRKVLDPNETLNDKAA